MRYTEPLMLPRTTLDLFESGDKVGYAHFPLGLTVIKVILLMRDGPAVEAATVDREGAIGGFVTLGA